MWTLVVDHWEDLDDELLVRVLHAVLDTTEAGEGKVRDLVRRMDGRRFAALARLDAALAARMAVLR